MPHPDGAHTHGSSFDWRWALVVAGIVAFEVGGGASGLFRGLQSALIWLASVTAVAVVAGSVIIFRATRRVKGTDYIRSVHGPTERDLVVEENAKMRRELADIRAMRRQVEAARALGLSWPPEYKQAMTYPEPVMVKAEVIEP